MYIGLTEQSPRLFFVFVRNELIGPRSQLGSIKTSKLKGYQR